jgi:hypothetical protein
MRPGRKQIDLLSRRAEGSAAPYSADAAAAAGSSGGSAGTAVSRRAAGTGRAAAVGSRGGAPCGPRGSARCGPRGSAQCGPRGSAPCGPQGSALGSGAATAGAVARRFVHPSVRMRGRASTPAWGRASGATSPLGPRKARAGAKAAVRAPRANRRAVAGQPESHDRPPGTGHTRPDRTCFGAQQEANAYLTDSQVAWRDLAAKRLRACHEIPPALSLRWHDEAPYGVTQLRLRCAPAGRFFGDSCVWLIVTCLSG